MASLVELLAMQRHQRNANEKPNTTARVGEGIMMGFANGMENLQAQKKLDMESRKNQLDAYVKLLDIQEKMQKAAQEKENSTMTMNMMKSLGLLPQDPQDKAAAQSLSNDALQTPDSMQPRAATNTGKMGKIFDEFAPSISMGKDGARINLRKRYPQQKSASMAQAANVAKAREALAKNIYNRDHPEKQAKDLMDRPVAYNPSSFELQKSGSYMAADKLLKDMMPGFNDYVDETQSNGFNLKDENFNDMFGGPQ